MNMKKKKIIFVCLCILANNLCVSQNSNIKAVSITSDISGRIPLSKIEKLHDLLLDYFQNRKNLYPQYDTIQFLDVYSVYLEDTVPWEYGMIENGDFLNHIILSSGAPNKYLRKRLRIKKKAREWHSATVISYSNQSVPLYALSMGELYPLELNGLESKLLDLIGEYEIVSMYDLKGTTVQCWIGVNKNRDVFVFRLEYGNKKITVFPAEDFQDDEIPCLFPKQDDWGKSIVWDYRMKQD